MGKNNMLNSMRFRELTTSEAPVEGVTYHSNREGNPVLKHQYRGDVGTTTNAANPSKPSAKARETWEN
jgi:hypothetical protein